MVLGFNKLLDMAMTDPDRSLADGTIALTTALFTLAEWCLVIGAIRYMGEVFDQQLLRGIAMVMQGLTSACISFYLTYKINKLITLPDRHEAPRRFWKLNVISAALIGLIYGALTYFIGQVVDAAAVNG
jgi:hypothetical protein